MLLKLTTIPMNSMKTCCFAPFLNIQRRSFKSCDVERNCATRQPWNAWQKRSNVSTCALGKVVQNGNKNKRNKKPLGVFFLGFNIYWYEFVFLIFGRLKMREFGCWRLLFLASFCCYIIGFVEEGETVDLDHILMRNNIEKPPDTPKRSKG